MKQQRPKPLPRRKWPSIREVNEYLRCKLPAADQLRKAGIPSKKEFDALESSRRHFLKTLAVGAGGLLAWYSGLLRANKAQAGQCTGGAWDVTCLLGTDAFLYCDEWGAKPPSASITVLNHPPTYFVVHHTASVNSTDYSLAHAISLAKTIQIYHMKFNGWIDTGQHFTHSRGTWLLEGRHLSIQMELLVNYPAHVLGAHVAGYNDVCLGVENEGTYTSQPPPMEMFYNLINLATTCCWYNSPMYSYTCKGHRDFNATECPGDQLYALLPCLRQWVAYLIEGGPLPTC
jgi:hypothetical protein